MNYPSSKVSEWQPDLPKGRIDNIYIHWSAHDYHEVFPAYHFCVALDTENQIVVVNTHDLRENMRSVYDSPDEPYAAHTRKRNSFALGISVMGMQGSKPDDFGPYPLTDELVDALCRVTAGLAEYYSVPIDANHIMTRRSGSARWLLRNGARTTVGYRAAKAGSASTGSAGCARCRRRAARANTALQLAVRNCARNCSITGCATPASCRRLFMPSADAGGVTSMNGDAVPSPEMRRFCAAAGISAV